MNDRRSCWFCGYDLTGCRTNVCAECGRPTDYSPPSHRVRHGRAFFIGLMAFLFITAGAFACLLNAATTGTVPLRAWVKIGILLLCASAPGGYAAWALCLVPPARSESGTLATVWAVSGVAVLAAAAILSIS